MSCESCQRLQQEMLLLRTEIENIKKKVDEYSQKEHKQSTPKQPEIQESKIDDSMKKAEDILSLASQGKTHEIKRLING